MKLFSKPENVYRFDTVNSNTVSSNFALNSIFFSNLLMQKWTHVSTKNFKIKIYHAKEIEDIQQDDQEKYRITK